MTLTGVPLIVLAAAVTVVAGVVMVRGWSPRGVLTRTIGVLLVEALAVVTTGLVVNRSEGFYPSWQALRGDTDTVAVVAPVPAGALDGLVPDDPFRWRPPGLSAWKLSEPPIVTLPAGYRERRNVTFPVVLFIGAPARRTPEAVTVTLAPTAGTTTTALLSLPGQLRHDLRVTDTSGWAVVGDSRLVDFNRSIDALPPALTAPLRLPS